MEKELDYLGNAHGRRNEHLLAAQSFTRLAENFPELDPP